MMMPRLEQVVQFRYQQSARKLNLMPSEKTSTTKKKHSPGPENRYPLKRHNNKDIWRKVILLICNSMRMKMHQITKGHQQPSDK